MNIRLCKAILVLCLTTTAATASEQLTIIHAGQLLATPGEQVLQEQSVLVSDGVIVEIIPGFVNENEVDAGYTQVTVLDLARAWATTGGCGQRPRQVA